MRLEVDDRNRTMVTAFFIVVKGLHLVCSDACLLLQQPRVDVRGGNNIMSRDFFYCKNISDVTFPFTRQHDICIHS